MAVMTASWRTYGAVGSCCTSCCLASTPSTAPHHRYVCVRVCVCVCVCHWLASWHQTSPSLRVRAARAMGLRGVNADCVCVCVSHLLQTNVAPQERIQAMINRILTMQWCMPADVAITPECRDLLTRLLNPDPARRATMQQISHHPWFLQNLPPVSDDTHTHTHTHARGPCSRFTRVYP